MPSRSEEDWFLFYAFIGRVLSNWSQCEYALEHCVVCIYFNCPGGRSEKRVPVLFEPKTAYLLKMLNSQTELAGFRDEGSALVAELKTYATNRHVLAHGAALQFDPTTKHIEVLKHEFKNNTAKMTKVHVPVGALEPLGADLAKLALSLCAFAMKLEKAFPYSGEPLIGGLPAKK